MVNLGNRAQKGSWSVINRQSGISTRETDMDIFKLWLDHGVHPRNETYEYIVMPGVTERSLDERVKNISVEVLDNSGEIQAVRHKELNVVQAVFYRPGTLKIEDQLSLTAEAPCIIMIKFDNGRPAKITVSDPNRDLQSLSFYLSAKLRDMPEMSSDWDEGKKTSRLTVKLPTGIHAGESKVIDLTH